CWTCCRHGAEEDRLLVSCSLFLFSCELPLSLLSRDGYCCYGWQAHGKKRGVRAGAYGGYGGHGLGKMVWVYMGCWFEYKQGLLREKGSLCAEGKSWLRKGEER
ncbi:hypothetical protein NC653_041345, partial [Populus alba x Populus x berolinensis]